MIPYISAFVAMLSWWFSDGVEVLVHDSDSRMETNMLSHFGFEAHSHHVRGGKHVRQGEVDDGVHVLSLSAILPG